MPKTPASQSMDNVEKSVACFLKPLGFRKRGRTFNRKTPDGLIQVINFQMGQHPIGPQYSESFLLKIFPFRQNLYGKFTVNLGVFVPSLFKAHFHKDVPAVIHEYDCDLRARLGELSHAADRWWNLGAHDDAVACEVIGLLQDHGLPFLEKFASRDQIVREWPAFTVKHESLLGATVAHLTVAMILSDLGRNEESQAEFARHVYYSQRHPKHLEHLKKLAEEFGWSMD